MYCFRLVMILGFLAASPFLMPSVMAGDDTAFDEDEETPDSLNPTADDENETPEPLDQKGDEDPRFIGTPSTESGVSSGNEADVQALKTRLDEVSKELALMRREKMNTSAPQAVYPTGSLGIVPPAANEEASDDTAFEDDELMDLLDDKKPQKKPVTVEQKKRNTETKKAEKVGGADLPKGNAVAQYNEACALYDGKAYPEAEAAFFYVIKAYPKSKEAQKSHYQLGKCAMAQKQYEKARSYFAKAYKMDPKGVHAPDCLYQLGLTFAEKKEGKKSACTAWKKLSHDFPKMPADVKKKMEAAQKKHGCS